ncbi:hypothetical protein BBJ28_00002364 [Nothophytophthora sp. Chile5]|nr:hypothetical protein BBJ28_00002364 [Nothophytophthora sp. Chile5]
MLTSMTYLVQSRGNHVASLHDQILRPQTDIASDREQYHQAIADSDYYRQSWEESEDERLDLDDMIRITDLSNEDLNLQIDRLRHSGAASYRALQDVVCQLRRSQPRGLSFSGAVSSR